MKVDETVITETMNVESLKSIQYLERSRPTRLDFETPIMIQERPNFIVPIKGPKEVREKDRVCLEGQIVPINDSSMTYTWLKNGKELIQSSRISTSNDFGYIFLEIAGTQVDDSGLYTLKVQNNVGEAISTHQLNVISYGNIDTQCQHPEAFNQIQYLERPKFHKFQSKEPQKESPKFLKHLNNIDDAEEGESVYIETMIEPKNDENLTIEWYKNDELITLGSRINAYFDFGNVVLNIKDLKSCDSGVYTCR